MKPPTAGPARRRRRRPPASLAEPPSPPPSQLIGDRDFGLFQGLVHREAGIWLSPVKKALLVGRLAKRLRALGLEGWRGYFERVEADPAERVRMLDCLCTNETHFFREPRHFEFLATRIFPRWQAEAEAGRRARRARLWSAACSTGEEPYSLAMTLLSAFPPGSGWDLEVLASDLSTRVLERAQAAVWPLEKSAEIPAAHLRAWMLRGMGPQEGLMKAGPEIRSLVRFQRLNLNDRGWPGLGRFDLVFCRNVLIYFDPPTKERVVGHLLEHLAPDGHLFLGHAESLSGMAHRVRAVLPTVYGLLGDGAPGHGGRPSEAPRAAQAP
ncbi:MAG TPA: protein-glutamate O-methyltransferase CheR [Anaeromyxobacteraceae bacterium]|nr:protein-glutamate O-methyltransferase CheR [Anaeromyxobacteraceae bacterium]